MNKQNFFKTHGRFLGFVIILTILLNGLRILNVSTDNFEGKIISTVLFVCILAGLLYFFIKEKYDYYIILWLSFYFACPGLILPFTTIGSLGLLNIIFVPLMIYKTLNFKNKYFIVIIFIFLICLLNISPVDTRDVISRIFLFLTPFIFFYFTLKHCKDSKFIIWSAILIAIINAPIAIYEIIFKPDWGTIVDWRGVRIVGNLFWHNSYSFYLLPAILALYAFYKKTAKNIYLIFMLLLVIINIFTFSRNGLFSLAISLLIFEAIYKTGFKLTKKKIVLAILLIISIALYIYILPNLDTHLTPSTIKERTSIWDTITPFIKGNLILGNGLGSYELHRINFLGELSSHNDYLNIIFELGLLGLSLFLLFIYFIFNDLKTNIYAKKLFRSGELGLAVLIGILVFSVVGNAAFTQVVALNAWIILACCVKHNDTN
jgi:O-antigen ligase